MQCRKSLRQVKIDCMYERYKYIHGENNPVYHIHVLYIYLFLFLVQNKFIFISSTEQTINI